MKSLNWQISFLGLLWRSSTGLSLTTLLKALLT